MKSWLIKTWTARFTAFPIGFEVVSPMSLIEDGSVKRQFYAQEGVPEYWIVFPETRTINAYYLKEGRYELNDVKAEKGILTSTVLADLKMDLSQIFDF